jgi:hypothetical protein
VRVAKCCVLLIAEPTPSTSKDYQPPMDDSDSDSDLENEPKEIEANNSEGLTKVRQRSKHVSRHLIYIDKMVFVTLP